MKLSTRKAVAITTGVVGGVILARRYLPEVWRKRFSQMPGAMMAWMVAHMPDE